MTIEITSVVINVQWWLIMLVALPLLPGLKKIKWKTVQRILEKLIKGD